MKTLSMYQGLFELADVLAAVLPGAGSFQREQISIALAADLKSARCGAIRLTEFASGLLSNGRAVDCRLFFDFLLRFDGYLVLREHRPEGAPCQLGPTIQVTDFEARSGRARAVIAAACASSRPGTSALWHSRAKQGRIRCERALDADSLDGKRRRSDERVQLTPRLDLIADRRIDFARAMADGALLMLQAADGRSDPTLRRALARARRFRLCERYRIAWSESGQPRAALTWGWLDDRAQERLRRLGLDALHWSELSEGLVPCLVDSLGEQLHIDRMKAELSAEFAASGHFAMVDMTLPQDV